MFRHFHHDGDDEPEDEKPDDGLDDLRKAVYQTVHEDVLTTETSTPLEAASALMTVENMGDGVEARAEIMEVAALLGMICPKHLFKLGIAYGMMLTKDKIWRMRQEREEAEHPSGEQPITTDGPTWEGFNAETWLQQVTNELNASKQEGEDSGSDDAGDKEAGDDEAQE